MIQDIFEMQSGVCFYKNNIKTSEKDDKELIKKMQKGDSQSRDDLVLKHIRFAIFLAKQNFNKKNEIEDLIQDSIEGIIRATDKVDLKYEGKFITYARWYAFSQIRRALGATENGTVVSRNMKDRYDRYVKEKIEAEDLGLPFKIDKSMERLGIFQGKISIDSFGDTESNLLSTDNPYSDFIKDYDEESMNKDLKTVLDKLSAAERAVLILHYGLFGKEEKSFGEIGATFKKSKTWAQYIEKKAFNNIKQNYPYLRDYLTGV